MMQLKLEWKFTFKWPFSGTLVILSISTNWTIAFYKQICLCTKSIWYGYARSNLNIEITWLPLHCESVREWHNLAATRSKPSNHRRRMEWTLSRWPIGKQCYRVPESILQGMLLAKAEWRTLFSVSGISIIMYRAFGINRGNRWCTDSEPLYQKQNRVVRMSHSVWVLLKRSLLIMAPQFGAISIGTDCKHGNRKSEVKLDLCAIAN